MGERRRISPLGVSPLEFPETDELPEGVKTVEWKDSFGYPVNLIPDIEYAVKDGYPLHIELYLPSLADPDGEPQKAPLIVHIQGSAWKKQAMFQSIGMLTRMAAKGYTIASVEYRPSETAPFPAQVEDVKSGISFLAAHADAYPIDLDRVALWGDSSGGHTALLTGITGDRELLPTGGLVLPDIRCIVDWYGPTEIAEMNYYPSNIDHTAADSPEGMLIGGKNVLENRDLAEKTVVMNYLRADIPTPPVLIMHGGSDMLVPFNQSARLYRRMKELGKAVEMIKLVGSNHGFMGFQCEEALEMVHAFLAEHLRVR